MSREIQGETKSGSRIQLQYEPPSAGLVRLPCAEELLVTLLGTRAELDVFEERLWRQFEHARGRLTGSIVSREDSEDISRGDACLGNGRGEENTLAEGRVCVNIDPSFALAVSASSYGNGVSGDSYYH